MAQGGSDGCSAVESDPAQGGCPCRSIHVSYKAKNPNFQDGEHLNKTKHAFSSIYTIAALLENSVQKNYFVFQSKIKLNSGEGNEVQVFSPGKCLTEGHG